MLRRIMAAVIASSALACGAPAAPSAPVAQSTPSGSSPPTASAAPSAPTLLDRMGGPQVLSAVVDELLIDVFADNRINKFFDKARHDPARARALHDALVAFFCAKAGGASCGGAPARSLGDAHAGMPIAKAHFDAFVEDVGMALAMNHVGRDVREALVASLESERSNIVAAPAH